MSTKHSRAIALAEACLAVMVSLGLIGCAGVGHSNDAAVGSADSNSNGSAGNSAATKGSEGGAMNDQIDPRLISANTKFGFKLYSELTKRSEGKNVFVSPSSVGLALAMVYNGAEGETKSAMARALEAQGMSLDDLNRAYAQLKAALDSPGSKVQLEIANSLWAKRGVSFRPEFLQRNQQFYSAEVTTLDFADPGAPATINSWVAGKTKGKIEKIIDQISSEAILFLLNAIYFKGTWTAEFDKAKTRQDNFTLIGGGQKRVPMMVQSGEYNYYEDEKLQAVSLPYGDRRVSMYIFLPARGGSLAEFHKQLTAEAWDKWMGQFAETKGDIVLPRFKVDYEANLNDPLKALGMGAAFEPGRANFTGMAETADNIYINQVKHKTFAEVNEEGTEAAAVTGIEMRATSMSRPRQTFQMIVDRPFFCAIRDNKTGTILFMGSITEPM